MQLARLDRTGLSGQTLALVVGWVTIIVAAGGCGSSHHGAPGPADAAADRRGDGVPGNGDAVGASGGANGDDDARNDAPGGGGGGIGPATDGAAGLGGSSGGDAGVDRPTTADAAPIDGGFGAGCNTLATGTPVTVTCAGDAGTPPASTGGTIVPGTYSLTAVTAYGACAAVDVAQTLVMTANTVVTVIDDPLNGLSRANATYTLAGSSMVQTDTCPGTDTRTIGFSAVTSNGVTTLTLISSDPNTTTVGVLTRQ